MTRDAIVLAACEDGSFAGHRDAELTVAAEFLTAPYPAWSAVGIESLYEAEAMYELRCVAVLPGS